MMKSYYSEAGWRWEGRLRSNEALHGEDHCDPGANPAIHSRSHPAASTPATEVTQDFIIPMRFDCWYKTVGQCIFKDDMQILYHKLRDADILVLATPVYIPLPGEMQNLINRLCPIIEPAFEFREGRTRARFSQEVRISKIVLVSMCG